MLPAVAVLACASVAILAYGWIEAGWLCTRVTEVTVADLPRALDGVRIGHLSDFHLGARVSRGNGASERAVAWVAARDPDIVCVTGDLVSHPRGEPRLRALLAQLRRPFIVLGNHDVAVTRDPFSRAAELRDLERGVLLRDQAAMVELRGERVGIVGVDPERYRLRLTAPHELVDPEATLRLLLCHFPGIVDRIPPGSFDVVLSGHLHAGQISVPLRRRRVGLAHPRSRFVAGIYRTAAGVMHVSPGSGTTFVPLRFFARPEVTELVLRRSHGREPDTPVSPELLE
jgi:predicted MPP superfamily phosphohydrolase